jgi:catechol 2,3-dioxygenase-like lactoylglutathione lyase family enzyme
MITGLDHVELWAKDIEETVKFYTDDLGFKRGRHTLTTRPDGATHEQFCVTMGDTMIEIFQADRGRAANDINPQRMGVNTFALRVDDMAATIKTLTERGVTISREPSPGGSFMGWRA